MRVWHGLLLVDFLASSVGSLKPTVGISSAGGAGALPVLASRRAQYDRAPSLDNVNFSESEQAQTRDSADPRTSLASTVEGDAAEKEADGLRGGRESGGREVRGPTDGAKLLTIALQTVGVDVMVGNVPALSSFDVEHGSAIGQRRGLGNADLPRGRMHAEVPLRSRDSDMVVEHYREPFVSSRRQGTMASSDGVACSCGCGGRRHGCKACTSWMCALLVVGSVLRDASETSSDTLRTLWSGLAPGHAQTAVGSRTKHPDPIGISIGFAAVAYAAYSIYKAKRESNRIISLFEANTQVKELEDKARRGEPLPNIVVIKGIIAADGRDVSTVSPRIDGLKDRVGEIKQPKNAWIEIARQAKRDPQLKGIADAIVERTGVDAADVPDIPEPGDTYARQSFVRGDGPYVLSEILVARICAKHQRVTEEKKSKKVLIKRPCRNESYNCFHGRRIADGLHLVDLDGGRADLDLPPADAVGLAGIAEPPPLFLPVNDVWTEFTHYLRRDGLSGPGGRHQRLDDLPPMRLSDPYTLLSEFIFVDVQSPGDLGGMPGNQGVLSAIADAYSGKDGPAKFLWEPRGFYDSVKNGGYNDVPAYANARFRKTEMVSAGELVERAQAAARQNALNTPFCEPTFSREELIQRRDQENCFRYTELAIPRGAPVTVLARPMVAEAGTGEGAECRIRLTSPLCSADEGKEFADLKSDRFRFRIRYGHTVENLLRLHDINVNAYYGLSVVGFCFAGWAAAGYPGVGGR